MTGTRPSTAALIASALLTACPQIGCKPRCDNCHPIKETIYECEHHVLDKPGTPCSTTVCIADELDSATCDPHLSLRAARCDADRDPSGAPEVTQFIRHAKCPGGSVRFVPWKTLYWGCADACSPFTYKKSCQTDSCDGESAGSGLPGYRGRRKQCGCAY